jgi:hypothetical protein
LPDRPDEPDADFLGYILGVFPVAGPPPGRSKQEIVILPDNMLESAVVSGLRKRDKPVLFLFPHRVRGGGFKTYIHYMSLDDAN